MAEARSARQEGSDAARLLLAAARERMAVAATDLLLPDRARLTEWQRMTAGSLLVRLVRSVEESLRSVLIEPFSGHDALREALSSARVQIALPILERAGVLADEDLTATLVRRVEEHRFWQSRSTPSTSELLFELIGDADENVAANAMELVVARSRRFDRFEDPTMGEVELPAELQHRLVWMVAAALRQYIVQQHHVAAVDGPVERVATELLGGYDESRSLESTALRLARRLHLARRIDGPFLVRVIEGGFLPLFIASLAMLCRLDPQAIWEIYSDPRGRGPVLLVRAAGIEREEAASLFFVLASRGPAFSGLEGEQASEQLELYDTIDTASARDVLRLWQANPAYRSSIARISTRSRGRVMEKS